MTRVKDSLAEVELHLSYMSVDLARIARSLERLVDLVERIALPLTIPAALVGRGPKF